MTRTRLFIENEEIELTDNVQFAITKQYQDLSNPTTIINDWSKTVEIPFTKTNNRIFGNLYKEDRIIINKIDNILDSVANRTYYLNTKLDWDEKTYTLKYNNTAVYFSLYGLDVKLLKFDNNGNIVEENILKSYTSSKVRNSITFSTDIIPENYKYTIRFELNSSPYEPTVEFDLPYTEEITTYTITFDIPELNRSEKRIDITSMYLVKGKESIFTDSNLTGMYFDPYKKLNFRLQFDDNVVMEGYLKTNSITRKNGTGTYNITLNGSLGKVLQELKKITLNSNEYTDEVEKQKYFWDTSDYIDIKMNQNTVKQSWDKNYKPDEITDLSLKSKNQIGYDFTDYIGFAPCNAKDEGFDYTIYQASYGNETVSLIDDLESISRTGEHSTFEGDTGISPKDAIPNGLLPREFSDYRSYLQTPFIMYNKFFQLFAEKAYDLTGYKFNMDKSWFNTKNPYWANSVMMLEKPDVKQSNSVKNIYEMTTLQVVSPTYFSVPIGWYNTDKEHNHSIEFDGNFLSNNGYYSKEITAQLNPLVQGSSEALPIATFGPGITGKDGYFTLGENNIANINGTIPICFVLSRTNPNGTRFVPGSTGELIFMPDVSNLIDPFYLIGNDSGQGHFIIKLNIKNSNNVIVKSRKIIFYDNPGGKYDIKNYSADEYRIVYPSTMYSGKTKYGFIYKLDTDIKDFIVTSNDLLSDGKFKIEVSCQLYCIGKMFSQKSWYRVGRGGKAYNYHPLLYYPTSGGYTPPTSFLDFSREGDYAYFHISNDGIYTNNTTLSMDVVTGNKRSETNLYLPDFWNNDVKPFDNVLNYCKTNRLGFFIDDLNKEINIKPLTNYLSDYNVVDWTNKVDLSSDFVLEPISFNSHNILFNYENNNTKLNSDYKLKNGFNFGEKNITTNYNFDNSTNKLFSGNKLSITNSDNVLSWKVLYGNEDDGCRYIYTTSKETFIYSKDKDNKFISQFGQYYFYKGRHNWEQNEFLSLPRITDDTEYQTSLQKFFYTATRPYAQSYYYPYLDLFDNNIPYNTINYSIPTQHFTTIYPYGEINGIYDNFWKEYINSLYNKNTKKLTCYVNLSKIDFYNFKFNTFVNINNTLYLVNKIYDYNPNNYKTKVELISINDLSGFIYNDFISRFDILNTDNTEITIPTNNFGTITAATFDSNNIHFTDNGELTGKFIDSITYDDLKITVYIEDNKLKIKSDGSYTPGDDNTINVSVYNESRNAVGITITRNNN